MRVRGRRERRSEGENERWRGGSDGRGYLRGNDGGGLRDYCWRKDDRSDWSSGCDCERI